MAMYLVEAKTINEYITTAVGSPKELLELILLLDNSDRVEHWKLVDHKPSDFGWSDNGWNKRKNQPKSVSFVILESGIDFNASNVDSDKLYYLVVPDNWIKLKDIKHY